MDGLAADDGLCLILIGTALTKANGALVREQAVLALTEFVKQA